MGVPVVALEGRRFLGRMGASFLHHVGLPDLAAAGPEAYVAAATDLAGNIERRLRLRRELRQRLADSPLFDPAAHARSLIQAYRQLWRDWCLASGNQSVIEAHRRS